MTFQNFSHQIMSFHNELALAHRNATPETWPAMRDAVLTRHDMLDDLKGLEF